MTARPKWRRLPSQAITAEEHAALERRRGRPITDDPIGTWTAARRDAGAIASQIHDDREAERTELLAELVEHRTTAKEPK